MLQKHGINVISKQPKSDMNIPKTASWNYKTVLWPKYPYKINILAVDMLQMASLSNMTIIISIPWFWLLRDIETHEALSKVQRKHANNKGLLSKEKNLTKNSSINLYRRKAKLYLTLFEQLPWLGRTALQDCMYEKLLHSYQENLQERWTKPKLMKATE